MFTKTGPTTGSMSGQATTTQGPIVEGKRKANKGSLSSNTHHKSSRAVWPKILYKILQYCLDIMMYYTYQIMREYKIWYLSDNIVHPRTYLSRRQWQRQRQWQKHKENTLYERPLRLGIFEAFDQSDEETWPDQEKDNDKDNGNSNQRTPSKSNPRDLWPSRHWLKFWQ